MTYDDWVDIEQNLLMNEELHKKFQETTTYVEAMKLIQELLKLNDKSKIKRK